MKATLALVIMTICSTLATAQAKAPDKRLLNDTDFRTALSQVEATLSPLEAQFKGIDLDKAPRISYSRGKEILAERDLALMEIDTIRRAVSKLRAKRTVSGELTLEESLDTLFYSIALWDSAEDFHSLTHLNDSARAGLAASMLVARIDNDLQARVEMLEKGGCS